MFVLVTGGAGFIGSHVVDALLAAGHEVRIVDYLHPAAHDREPSYVADVEWLRDDLRAGADAAVAGVDAVLHQAAMVGLGVDLSDIAAYTAHNDLGTAELLRSLHARGFDSRIVLASSMVVYGEGRYACPAHGRQPAPPRAPGDLDAGRFEPGCPVCGGPMEPQSVPEDAPADPRNVYAATKLHQEHLVNAYARETGAAAVALRYHNVYGPRMPRDTPYAGVASIFRSRLEAGAAPRVTEDGHQRRDFVHVRDVAAANLLALESSETGAFNVASGEPHSVGEMAAALSAAMGGPAPEITGAWRAGDVRHVFASVDRIRAELGYTPGVTFADGMAEFASAPLR
ncbi:MAG: NAD-dependent epimerase/dehydratase family protein [Solirubrobacteraceae bacterium]